MLQVVTITRRTRNPSRHDVDRLRFKGAIRADLQFAFAIRSASRVTNAPGYSFDHGGTTPRGGTVDSVVALRGFVASFALSRCLASLRCVFAPEQ